MQAAANDLNSAMARDRRRIVTLLVAFSFSTHFHRTCMSIAKHPIQEEFGKENIGDTEFGWVISAFLIPYALCMTPGGLFADRVGSRRALACVGFGTALCCALTGVCGWLAASGMGLIAILAVVRGSMGACTAPLYPSTGRTITRWVSFRHRGAANSIVIAAMGIGMAVNYPLFGFLVDNLGWKVSFLCTGAVTAAMAGLWLRYARDYPPGLPNDFAAPLAAGNVSRRAALEPADDGSSAAVWKNRSLWLLAISYAAVGYVEYLVGYWSENYFEKVLELPTNTSRWYASAPPFALAIGMLLGGVISDRLVGALGYRWGRATVALAGMLLGSVCMVLAPMGGSAEWACAMFTLAMGAFGVCEAPAWTTAVDLGGTANATSAGIVNTGGNVGGFVSPVLSPFVAAQFLLWTTGESVGSQDLSANVEGWSRALQLAGLVGLAGAVLWLWIDASDRGEKRKAKHPSE